MEACVGLSLPIRASTETAITRHILNERDQHNSQITMHSKSLLIIFYHAFKGLSLPLIKRGCYEI